MADGPRITLQEEIDTAKEHALMLDELAAVLEGRKTGKRRAGAETPPAEAIAALEYGAQCARRYAANMEDIRADYDHKVSIPVDPPS